MYAWQNDIIITWFLTLVWCILTIIFMGNTLSWAKRVKFCSHRYWRLHSLTSGIKKWIYLHSCLSAWLQQWSAELTSLFVRLCSVTLTADWSWRGNSVHVMDVMRGGGTENRSFWRVLNLEKDDLDLNTQTHTHPWCVLLLANVHRRGKVYCIVNNKYIIVQRPNETVGYLLEIFGRMQNKRLVVILF